MPAALASPAWYTLPPLLDSRVVDVLRERLATDAGAAHLILDAGRVRQMDPVGALRLWDVCTEFARQTGVRVELLHLSDALAARLRHHPLLGLRGPDDALFADPLDGPRDSTR
jgi:hypothetical protein